MQVNFEEFKFDKLDAITQFHIVRRVAPVIGELLAVLSNASIKQEGPVTLSSIDFDKLAKDLGPVLGALSKLPDDDVNYVLYSLLKAVNRKNAGGGWSRVLTDTNHFMFQDIKDSLPVMFQLAMKSFQNNLQGFISALPSGLQEGARQSNVIG